MSSIQILSDDVINQIAAGEVIERPASAVKELVENALDAGADVIRVQTENGGKTRIRVQDNGKGMEPEDLDLCYLRHTTSKLRSADDLFRVATNGFRGEAIASIASIARLSIDTRPANRDVGLRLSLEGGKVLERSEIALPVGTTFQVDNLFFNTPVRANFLGSDALENSRILDVLTRIAIAHPKVRWEYRSGGREAFTGVPGDLRSRLAEAIGVGITRKLVPVEWEENGIRIHGFTSPPDEMRGKRSHQFFYLHQRPIWNNIMSKALSRAYEPYGKQGFPISVLFVEMPVGAFDVNVHPAKREVRFSNESLVYQAVHHAVREALQNAGGTPVIALSEALPALQIAPLADEDTPPRAFAMPIYAASPEENGPAVFAPPAPSYTPPAFNHVPPVTRRMEDPAIVQDLFSLPEYGKVVPLPSSLFQTPAIKTAPATPSARTLSSPPFLQFAKTYLVCEDSQGLLLIDQNAAHQRVLYEQALSRLENQESLEAQELLFPELIELERPLVPLLEEHLEALSRLGFHLEPFGGGNWQLRGIPLHLPLSRAVQALHDFLTNLQETTGKGNSVHAAVARAWALGSAIPAGQDLSQEEMAALMDQLLGTRDPYQSPVGRPTLLRLPTEEMHKRFKR